MCYRIDSEVIIANFFAECDDCDELKLSTLSEIKQSVEKKYNDLGKYLYINTSIESILNAINSNPKYFSFNRNTNSIQFNGKKREELYEDVYGIFNSKLNMKIKFEFLHILEEILENIIESYKVSR